MKTRIRSASAGLSPSFALLCLLMIVLWIAGGASRADALGQVPVRAAAALALAAGLVLVDRRDLGRYRPVWWLLMAAILLAGLQLVPLPPAWWQGVPGRAPFADAAVLSGQAQPWRPLSLVPTETRNALFSLVVPLATLLLLAGCRDAERARLPGVLLGLVTASVLLGLAELAGGSVDNPLINKVPGMVSANFANRNHFALFVALGCALAPVWAFNGRASAAWRAPVAIGLAVLFTLIILATGSRAGMIVGLIGLVGGWGVAMHPIRRELARYPRWVLPALLAGVALLIAALVLVSVAADRAVSINRAFALEPGEDLRRRALGTVLAMMRAYWPWGSGLGGFDPLFRAAEPFRLLTLTYFNHAHDDLLEIVLDAGLPGVLLLGSALAWWLTASISAWRAGRAAPAVARLASVLLLLVLVASAFDYPARTPLIMAAIVLAATWLCEPEDSTGNRRPALPPGRQHL